MTDAKRGQAAAPSTTAESTNDTNPDLTKAQEIALTALLEGASLASAARKAGVKARTVSAWIREDEGFADALDQGKRDLRNSFVDRAPGLIDRALDTYEDTMAEAPCSRSRVMAANSVTKLFRSHVPRERDDERGKRIGRLLEQAEETQHSEPRF